MDRSLTLPTMRPARPRMGTTRSSTTRLQGKKKTSKQMIDLFLAEAKALEDRVPTLDELRRARKCLQTLDAITREDHLRSIDQLLAQIPNEFAAAVKQLEAAESFVMLCAAGDVTRVKRRLDADWELINAVDRDGHTALHSAAANNNIEVVALLLENGAKPNTQDYEGYLPLHWGVENNSLAACGLLLQAGTDFHIRNNVHKKPMDFIDTLKPKHQSNMKLLFSTPREECAALAAALTRGDAMDAAEEDDAREEARATSTLMRDAGMFSSPSKAVPAPVEEAAPPPVTTAFTGAAVLSETVEESPAVKSFSPRKRRH